MFSLVTRDPFRDSHFGSSGGSVFDSPFGSTMMPSTVGSFRGGDFIRTKTDLVECANDFKMYCELPGIKKEDIDINIDNQVVTISGTKAECQDAANDWYHVRERQCGRFKRSLTLPVNADGSRASASNFDGVLVLTFPKLAPSTTHRKLMIA